MRPTLSAGAGATAEVAGATGKDEISESADADDDGRTSVLVAERDRLVEELTSACGTGRRERTFDPVVHRDIRR